MRRFGTQGRVRPEQHYIVSRTEEITDFIHRIKEGKVWEGNKYYQAGKKQLAAYVKSEAAVEGYYVVFDHRQNPEPRRETEKVEDVEIRSYVIPVIQKLPSAV